MAFNKALLELCIRKAIENASSSGSGPFAALVVKDGKVIAEGTNAVTRLSDPSAHAEVQAIRKACQVLQHFELKDCEIYTSCEPCPMCLGAIYWARPNAVYFAADKKDAARGGFDDAFIYEEIAKPMNERKIHFQKIEGLNATEPFEAFLKNPKKVAY